MQSLHQPTFRCYQARMVLCTSRYTSYPLLINRHHSIHDTLLSVSVRVLHRVQLVHETRLLTCVTSRRRRRTCTRTSGYTTIPCIMHPIMQAALIRPMTPYPTLRLALEAISHNALPANVPAGLAFVLVHRNSG